MSTSVTDAFAARFGQLKQQREGTADAAAQVINGLAKPQTIIIKPAAKSWEELEILLQKVINFDGVWDTARDLFDQGYGAELETAAELALQIANKPHNFFTKSISRKSGNWATKTLQQVHDTWDVRRNALRVIEQLKLSEKSHKAILSMSWKLKGTIIRFLSQATEPGAARGNPAILFFYLVKKAIPSTA